jgi:hypothetical protein
MFILSPAGRGQGEGAYSNFFTPSGGPRGILIAFQKAKQLQIDGAGKKKKPSPQMAER